MPEGWLLSVPDVGVPPGQGELGAWQTEWPTLPVPEPGSDPSASVAGMNECATSDLANVLRHIWECNYEEQTAKSLDSTGCTYKDSRKFKNWARARMDPKHYDSFCWIDGCTHSCGMGPGSHILEANGGKLMEGLQERPASPC